jgi:tRNA(Arg) A34 adenosine deaminase TadA
MSHEEYLREALALAREGMQRGDGGPFGALIVLDGEVIGRAWNRVVADKDPTAHAEVMAIRRATTHIDHFHLHGARLYTSCEPCPMCLGAAYWAHVESIHYAATGDDAAQIGFSDELILKQLRLPAGERQIPAENLLREEGKRVFQDYHALTTNTDY